MRQNLTSPPVSSTQAWAILAALSMPSVALAQERDFDPQKETAIHRFMKTSWAGEVVLELAANAGKIHHSSIGGIVGFQSPQEFYQTKIAEILAKSPDYAQYAYEPPAFHDGNISVGISYGNVGVATEFNLTRLFSTPSFIVPPVVDRKKAEDYYEAWVKLQTMAQDRRNPTLSSIINNPAASLTQFLNAPPSYRESIDMMLHQFLSAKKKDQETLLQQFDQRTLAITKNEFKNFADFVKSHLEKTVQEELQKIAQNRAEIGAADPDAMDPKVVQRTQNLIRYTSAVSKLGQALDPEHAKECTVAEAALQTAILAAAMYGSGPGTAAALGPQLANSAVGLLAICLQKPAKEFDYERHKQVMEALNQIHTAINDLRKEIRQGFVGISEQISQFRNEVVARLDIIDEALDRIKDTQTRDNALIKDAIYINHLLLRSTFSEQARAKYSSLLSTINQTSDSAGRLIQACKAKAPDTVVKSLLDTTTDGLTRLIAETRHVNSKLAARPIDGLAENMTELGGSALVHPILLEHANLDQKPNQIRDHIAIVAAAKIASQLLASPELPAEIKQRISAYTYGLVAHIQTCAEVAASFRQESVIKAALDSYFGAYAALVAETKNLAASDRMRERKATTPELFKTRTIGQPVSLAVDTESANLVSSNTALPPAGDAKMIFDESACRSFQIPKLKPKDSLDTEESGAAFYDRYVKDNEPSLGGKKQAMLIDRTTFCLTPTLSEMVLFGDEFRTQDPKQLVERYGIQEIIEPLPEVVQEEAQIREESFDNPKVDPRKYGAEFIKIGHMLVRTFRLTEYLDVKYKIKLAWPASDPNPQIVEGALPALEVLNIVVTPPKEHRRHELRFRDFKDHHSWSGVRQGEGGFAFHRDWATNNVRTPITTAHLFNDAIFGPWNRDYRHDLTKALKLIAQSKILKQIDDKTEVKIDISRTSTEGQEVAALDVTVKPLRSDKSDNPEQTWRMEAKWTKQTGSDNQALQLQVTNITTNQSFIVDTSTQAVDFKFNGFKIDVSMPLTNEQHKDWQQGLGDYLSKTAPRLGLDRVAKLATTRSSASLNSAARMLDDARALLLCLAAEGYRELGGAVLGLTPVGLPSGSDFLAALVVHSRHPTSNLINAIDDVTIGATDVIARFDKARQLGDLQLAAKKSTAFDGRGLVDPAIIQVLNRNW